MYNNQYPNFMNGMVNMPQNQIPQYNQNPYLDRLNQLQNYQNNMQMPQVPQQPNGIIGRVVNDFSEITANDVPMNGSAAFFPKSDGMEIQARSWTANGTIQTVSYRPVINQGNEQTNNAQGMDLEALNNDMRDFRNDTSERLSRIEQVLSNFVPAVNNHTVKSKTTTKGKKEVTTDE